MTGIDLEADLFDHLGGEIIVAVGDVDFDSVEANPTANAVDAVMMLSYRDGSKDQLTATMEDATNLLLERVGLDTNRLDVGADDQAVALDLGILGMLAGDRIGYLPGYVLHDGYLTLGSTKNALEDVVAGQNGAGSTLASDAEYLRSVSLLPADRQFLAYIDMRHIIRQLDPDTLDMSLDQYRVLQQSLGTVAISSYSPHCVDYSAGNDCELPAGADASRFTAALTLFPE